MTGWLIFAAACHIVAAILWFASGVWPAMGMVELLLGAVTIVIALDT